MAIRDIFKKKPKEEPAKKEVESKKEPKEEKKETIKMPKRQAKPGEAYRVLKSPHITEKATDLTEKNQYIFKVWPKTNKFEIKKAVEDLYGVSVVSVKIIRIPRKKRRLGKISGWRKKYKKAIVKLKEGQKIEVLPR